LHRRNHHHHCIIGVGCVQLHVQAHLLLEAILERIELRHSGTIDTASLGADHLIVGHAITGKLDQFSGADSVAAHELGIDP